MSWITLFYTEFLYIKHIYKLITVNAFGMFSLQNMLQATKAWGTFCYVAMFWQLKAYEGFRTDCVKYWQEAQNKTSSTGSIVGLGLAGWVAKLKELFSGPNFFKHPLAGH